MTIRDQKFAEPVSLSSTVSADLPLPGTAFGTGFVLLALRARRKQHTNALARAVKRVRKGGARNLRTFPFPTVRERIVQCDKTPKRRSPARGRDQKNSPSQFRFRPPFPLTFPLRVLPSDSVSTYLRSVLGAITTLTRGATRSRGRKRAWPQFADISFFNISTANLPTCGHVCGKEKRACGRRGKTPQLHRSSAHRR
jgi:hypothetical protein